MSTRVSLIVTDDLDGSGNAHTISFDLDGVSYEIDLSDENRAKLEQVLAPFIGAGRRVPRTGRGRRATRQDASSADHAAVRAWAESAGLKISGRGRISGDILREYDLSVQRTNASLGLGGDQRGD